VVSRAQATTFTLATAANFAQSECLQLSARLIAAPASFAALSRIEGQDGSVTTKSIHCTLLSALYKSFKDYKKELEGSEGEQFAYEQALEKQKETPAAQTKPNTEVKQTEPVKETVKATNTTSSQNVPANAVRISGGTVIRKPVENASGGGKAEGMPASLASKVEEVKPIYVRPSNLNPFDTSSMSKPGKPMAEAKPEKPTTPEPKPTKTEAEPKPVKQATEVVAAPKSSLVPDHVAEDGIVLKVQLFALKGELKDYDKITKLFGNQLSGEQLPNGFTRYYGGKVQTMAEAQKLLEKAKAAGYAAAFIAGFKDGTRLTTDQVNALQ